MLLAMYLKLSLTFGRLKPIITLSCGRFLSILRDFP
jgi:hypothetical protein